MRLAFFGDIVGRTGREALIDALPGLIRDRGFDFVIANGENAAHGYGITTKMCAELYAAGVDCITTGNHVWDQKELVTYADTDQRLLRPANFQRGVPGNGATVLTSKSGAKKVLVINVMLRLFMEPMNDPFAAVDALISARRLGQEVDAVVIDMHGEATSEKQAMGWFCDGRASLVVGTHTHVPTADHRVLPRGTAYQTDAGMCGCYDSVIGMQHENATARFLTRVPHERLEPAEGPATLCGLQVDTDDKTGLATAITPLRLGGVLSQTS